MTEIKIGNTLVGDGHPCYVVAEIGINHNGDLDIAKKLIDLASTAGCSAVKFQKRTVDVVYTAEELARTLLDRIKRFPRRSQQRLAVLAMERGQGELANRSFAPTGLARTAIVLAAIDAATLAGSLKWLSWKLAGQGISMRSLSIPPS